MSLAATNCFGTEILNEPDVPFGTWGAPETVAIADDSSGSLEDDEARAVSHDPFMNAPVDMR